MSSLVGQHIVLGITAGVAAYKTPALVRALRAAGAEIQVVMSTNAKKFVTPPPCKRYPANLFVTIFGMLRPKPQWVISSSRVGPIKF
ncbi:MAG: hypothetical protein CM15mP120_07790 [Pseudomonadota bacterium]|nr:MAG: hypothetical protein CM15mP120_07790 [Pseudomonadota bacterium]